MNEKILALAVMAKDEASATLAKIEGHLGNLATKADLTGRAMGGLHDILRGIGTGIGIAVFLDLQNVFEKLVNVLPDLIHQGLGFVDTVESIQRATGASAVTASHFAGEMAFLGKSTENLNTRLGVLAKSILAHPALLRQLGVATMDANGHFLDSITIINNVRNALSQQTDGIVKTKDALILFGKAGADMIDWLSLTPAQIALVDHQLDVFGVTLTQKMVEDGKSAEREMNLLGLAIQGIANTITTTAAPLLIAAIDTITKWVEQNKKAIITFFAQVLGFIAGVFSAITGSKLDMSTFVTSFNAAGDAATHAGDDATIAGDKAARAAKAAAAANAAAISGIEKHIRGINDQEHAIDRTVRAIDKEERALDRETRTIDKQISALNAKQAAQHKASDAAIAGIDRELAKQLALLDAQDKERRQQETRAQLAQSLADAQRQLAIAQRGDANGVVDPEAVHSALEAVASIQQQMGDEAYQTAQDAKRDAVTAAAETAKAQIQSAQDARDAAIEAERAKAEAAKAAIAEQKQGLEDLKQRYADQKQALEDLKLKLQDQVAALRDVKTAGDASLPPIVSHVKNIAGGVDSVIGKMNGDLKKAMEDAAKTGKQMGKDIKAAIDSIGGAITTVVGGLDTINKALDDATGKDQLAKLFLVLAGVAALSGNLPLALGFLALAGVKVAIDNAGSAPSQNIGGPYNTDPKGNPTGPSSQSGGILGLPATPGPGWIWDPITKTWVYPGSAAMGLDYVPYDNYLSYLHKGEKVVTAADAQAGTTIVTHSHTYLDGRQIAETVDRHLFGPSRIYQGSVPGSGF